MKGGQVPSGTNESWESHNENGNCTCLPSNASAKYLLAKESWQGKPRTGAPSCTEKRGKGLKKKKEETTPSELQKKEKKPRRSGLPKHSVEKAQKRGYTGGEWRKTWFLEKPGRGALPTRGSTIEEGGAAKPIGTRERL